MCILWHHYIRSRIRTATNNRVVVSDVPRCSCTCMCDVWVPSENLKLRPKIRKENIVKSVKWCRDLRGRMKRNPQSLRGLTSCFYEILTLPERWPIVLFHTMWFSGNREQKQKKTCKLFTRISSSVQSTSKKDKTKKYKPTLRIKGNHLQQAVMWAGPTSRKHKKKSYSPHRLWVLFFQAVVNWSRSDSLFVQTSVLKLYC